jgi:hypothetical protein
VGDPVGVPALSLYRESSPVHVITLGEFTAPNQGGGPPYHRMPGHRLCVRGYRGGGLQMVRRPVTCDPCMDLACRHGVRLMQPAVVSFFPARRVIGKKGMVHLAAAQRVVLPLTRGTGVLWIREPGEVLCGMPQLLPPTALPVSCVTCGEAGRRLGFREVRERPGPAVCKESGCLWFLTHRCPDHSTADAEFIEQRSWPPIGTTARVGRR